MPAFAGVLAIDSFIASLKNQKSYKANSFKSKENSISNKLTIDLDCLLIGINFLLLQVGIAFYQGVFFCIASGLLFMKFFIFQYICFKNTKFKSVLFVKDKFKNIKFSVNLILFRLLIWFNTQIYSQYIVFFSEKGGRPWAEVATQIPKLWSYGFNTLSTPKMFHCQLQFNKINQDFYPGPFSEHSLFPGYAFIILIFIGIWFGYKNLKGEKSPFLDMET